MATEKSLPDQLWAVFKLLEMANLEALHTKRQVALIANPDPLRAATSSSLPVAKSLTARVRTGDLRYCLAGI